MLQALYCEMRCRHSRHLYVFFDSRLVQAHVVRPEYLRFVLLGSGQYVGNHTRWTSRLLKQSNVQRVEGDIGLR